MSARAVTTSCLVAVLGIAAFAGWSWWNGAMADPQDEEFAATDHGTGTTAKAGGAVPLAPAPQPLTFNLKVGDKFPLIKKVENIVEQPSAKGIVRSTSTLELLLGVTVEEIYRAEPGRTEKDSRDGQKRLQVAYQRIRYSQDLPGQEIHYDSEQPPARIPLEVQGYHGLKDNAFQFWLGPDNQILEIIGFDQFLDRCLKDVDANKRQQVRQSLAATSGADGIANFIDDSIGLLPPEAVKLGDSWERTRQILQPVPMHITNKYVLEQLTPQHANVAIMGRIDPSTTWGPDQPGKNVKVTIRGGNCFGSCIIDRRTGLPMQSKVEQQMTMKVQLANSLEFDQRKRTVITIRAFPEQEIQQQTALPLSPPGAPVRK